MMGVVIMWLSNLFKRKEQKIPDKKITSISKVGLDLIKFFEGYRDEAYQCSAGIWTIGWGSTIVDQVRVKKGDTISKSKAQVALKSHLSNEVYPVIKSLVKVPLTQGQFDALCSFIYNLGAWAFEGSTLLRKLNAGDYNGVGKEFHKWVYADGRKLPGLITRRRKEAELFIG